MGRMVRRQGYLDKEQDQAIKRLAAARGITESEALRKALTVPALVEESFPIDPAAWDRAKLLTKRLLAQYPSMAVDPKWDREDIYGR